MLGSVIGAGMLILVVSRRRPGESAWHAIRLGVGWMLVGVLTSAVALALWSYLG